MLRIVVAVGDHVVVCGFGAESFAIVACFGRASTSRRRQAWTQGGRKSKIKSFGWVRILLFVCVPSLLRFVCDGPLFFLGGYRVALRWPLTLGAIRWPLFQKTDGPSSHRSSHTQREAYVFKATWYIGLFNQGVSENEKVAYVS